MVFYWWMLQMLLIHLIEGGMRVGTWGVGGHKQTDKWFCPLASVKAQIIIAIIYIRDGE